MMKAVTKIDFPEKRELSPKDLIIEKPMKKMRLDRKDSESGEFLA